MKRMTAGLLAALLIAAMPALANNNPPAPAPAPVAYQPRCSDGGLDCWWGPDKKLHLAAGIIAGYGGTLIASELNGGYAHPKLIGWGFGCAVGVAKELHDPVFSRKDAIVTCVGSAIGALTGGLVVDYNRRTRAATVSYSKEF